MDDREGSGQRNDPNVKKYHDLIYLQERSNVLSNDLLGKKNVSAPLSGGIAEQDMDVGDQNKVIDMKQEIFTKLSFLYPCPRGGSFLISYLISYIVIIYLVKVSQKIHMLNKDLLRKKYIL